MSELMTANMTPEPEADFMNIDETDFSSMTRAQQIRHLEVEGYLVMPSILPQDTIRKIKSEMALAPMSHTSYSTQQTRSDIQPQWVSKTVAELIGFPPIIEFLTDLMGPDIVFNRGFTKSRFLIVQAFRIIRTASLTAPTFLATREVARAYCAYSFIWMI